MTFKIACIGEPLAEISNGNDGLKIAFGGDTLNTAIYCARAVSGRDIGVQYVTAVGRDTMSEAAVELMENEGLDTSYIQRNDMRNIGIYSIQNDDDGERSFHYWRENSAARLLFSNENSPEWKAIKDADIVYLSGISIAVISQEARDQLLLALQELKKSGGKLAFDSNYRPSLWPSAEIAKEEIAKFWHMTDIALASVDDEMALFEDKNTESVAERLKSAGVSSGAIKRGAEGPLSLSDDNVDGAYKAAEKVVDTTGAGDSFNGAYLAAIARGETVSEALMHAHSLASEVVGYQGAILPQTRAKSKRRVGHVIGLKPEHAEEYIRLHADVWPGVLERLKKSNFVNYSIFLKRPEHLMFGYFEYVGDDFEKDDAAIAADPITKDWWAVCGPMQEPLQTRLDGEWWADMEEVFHLD